MKRRSCIYRPLSLKTYRVTFGHLFLRGLGLNWVFNVNGAFLHNGIMGIFRGILNMVNRRVGHLCSDYI